MWYVEVNQYTYRVQELKKKLFNLYFWTTPNLLKFALNLKTNFLTFYLELL